jgi:hypothetical protein
MKNASLARAAARQPTGRCLATGGTLSAQYAASATLLNNGKVLIAGGITPGCRNNHVVEAQRVIRRNGHRPRVRVRCLLFGHDDRIAREPNRLLLRCD